jgi:hypothetical protein
MTKGQAADSLTLARPVAANVIIAREVEVRAQEIIHRGGKRSHADPAGARCLWCARQDLPVHGFDQIHAYRAYGLIEALAPDPTWLDAVAWITGYSGIRHSSGITLHDLMPAGRRSDDARVFFSWYGADFATDPAAYVEGPRWALHRQKHTSTSNE